MMQANCVLTSLCEIRDVDEGMGKIGGANAMSKRTLASMAVAAMTGCAPRKLV